MYLYYVRSHIHSILQLSFVSHRLFLDWHYYLPLIISIICAILTVCVLIVSMVELNQLRAELDSLKNPASPVLASAQRSGPQPASPQPVVQADPTEDRNDSSVSSGTAYVRWGRSTCPDDNQVLYSG